MMIQVTNFLSCVTAHCQTGIECARNHAPLCEIDFIMRNSTFGVEDDFGAMLMTEAVQTVMGLQINSY